MTENTFFWGGKYAPGALVIGMNKDETVSIPRNGLPCRFFLSKKNSSWCLDITVGAQGPHRLYAEWFRAGGAGADLIKEEQWNFFSNVSDVAEWVIARKVAYSHGGGMGCRYTVVKGGVTPKEIQEIILRRIISCEPDDLRQRMVSHRGRYSSQHDFCREEWGLGVDGHRLTKHSVLSAARGEFLPDTWEGKPAGWYVSSPVHPFNNYFCVDEETAREREGFLVFVGDDGLYHSRRALKKSHQFDGFPEG